MLRLYRDLISLRKHRTSLGNCRKDLTEIRFDEQAKTFVMKRTDPAGSNALLIFNFSAEAQSVPIAGDSNRGDCSYGQETKSTAEARGRGRLKF